MESSPTLQSREGGHACLGWEAETRGREKTGSAVSKLVDRWEVEENGVGTFS